MNKIQQINYKQRAKFNKSERVGYAKKGLVDKESGVKLDYFTQTPKPKPAT
jgi:hypothetical protein